VIEKRLRCAAEGDFAICLYNPASRHRPEALKKACEVLLGCRAPGTVCGVARCIGREGESYTILTLDKLRDYPADMFSTVFIGSSRTREISGRMETPRGYKT
jgi:precorrin-3B C17-methyltransferase